MLRLLRPHAHPHRRGRCRSATAGGGTGVGAGAGAGGISELIRGLRDQTRFLQGVDLASQPRGDGLQQGVVGGGGVAEGGFVGDEVGGVDVVVVGGAGGAGGVVEGVEDVFGEVLRI